VNPCTRDKGLGLLRHPVTSDLWCRAALLEFCFLAREGQLHAEVDAARPDVPLEGPMDV